MDSGNSGSLQSSSGGDEEYDSRAAAHSLFMTTHSLSHLRPISTAPPPPPPPFDPLSNYIQLHNPNALPLNPNTPWPRPASVRSDPNPSTSINPIIFQSPTAALGETNDHLVAAQNHNTAARNPRKRSRASRRAPTTVLTTDTTNFRAMVQEFTGIPAPPFSTSSFSRTRLDLFTTRSTAFEAAQPPPPYLRHAFPQKVQSPPPFLASSTASSVATSSTAPINFQLPITLNSNLFNVQNQNSLTSLLQSNPKFLLSSSNAITSKINYQDSFGIPTSDHIRVADFDDHQFGLSHQENHTSTTLINGLPNLVSPDQIGAEKDRNDKNAESGYHHQIKTAATIVGGGGYSFSPAGFRGGKGTENIATRGEGMVDSWICSSE